MSITPAFWIVGILNLVLRLYFSLYTAFGNDEFWIYRKSLKLLSGELPTTGGPIFYTATELPGSLFPILVGAPLYFTQGHAMGAGLFCAFLNFISVLITYKLMSECFPKLNRLGLYIFILFAPWTFLFTTIWNPSFLHPFSALFFYSLWRRMKSPNSFWATFGMSFSIVCALQIHLSFVLLIGITIISFLLGLIRRPNVKGLVFGGMAGMITLIPYIIERVTENQSLLQFLTSNTQFSFGRMLDQLLNLPLFFLRYLSFPTGEVTRFINSGSGIKGLFDFLNAYPLIWPVFITGFGLSIALIGLSFQFYFRKETLQFYFKKKSLFSMKSEDAPKRFEAICLLIPVFTAGMFLFSVKNPSAHTFWILYPISFYGLLWAWQKFQKKLSSQAAQRLFIVYVISVSIYSIAGYRLTQEGIIKNVPNEAKQSSFSPAKTFFDTDSLV